MFWEGLPGPLYGSASSRGALLSDCAGSLSLSFDELEQLRHRGFARACGDPRDLGGFQDRVGEARRVRVGSFQVSHRGRVLRRSPSIGAERCEVELAVAFGRSAGRQPAPEARQLAPLPRKLLLRSSAQRSFHVSSDGRTLSNAFAPAAASDSHEQRRKQLPRAEALRETQRGTGDPSQNTQSSRARALPLVLRRGPSGRVTRPSPA